MEDTNFQNRRMVKRREMEAQGGGEVRRLHIVYFLSRNGCNEHPHLIRIHHLSKNGVRLRDIKRWLGELRGKDMPESFAWSYKRRYKTDYVWQDILDDDLLTPISDNEYILKGSEISPTNDNIDYSSRTLIQEETPKDSQTTSHSSNYASSKASTSSSVEDSSPTFGSETSTSTADDGQAEASSPASKSIVLLKKRKANKIDTIIDGKIKSGSKTAAPSVEPRHGKSHSSGIFQKLISCGGMDTNDSIVTMTNKQYKPLLKACSCDSADGVRDSVKEKQQRAPFRPLYGPKCSQCGKTFKPEKLHSHMISCKGMKALAKTSNAASDIPRKSTACRNEDLGSAYLLAQNC